MVRVLYILDIRHVLDLSFENIFSHSEDFHFLHNALGCKVLNLDQFQFVFVLFLLLVLLLAYLRIHRQIQDHEDLTLFSSKTFMALALMKIMFFKLCDFMEER